MWAHSDFQDATEGPEARMGAGGTEEDGQLPAFPGPAEHSLSIKSMAAVPSLGEAGEAGRVERDSEAM